MQTINIVAIRIDGRTITTQALGWEAAAREVVRWADDNFYNSTECRIAKIFLSDGVNGLEEHTVEGLRNDLKTGRVQKADEADERRRFDLKIGNR